MAPPEGAPSRRVLVVDDEADIRAALKDLLESGLGDVDVATAADGASALALVESWRPDVIVTDYRMPGMTGVDFLQAARALAPTTPAILVTAYPDLDLAVRSINEARVESFLQKPVDPELLLERVASILRDLAAKHEAARALARELNALRAQRARDEPDAAPG